MCIRDRHCSRRRNKNIPHGQPRKSAKNRTLMDKTLPKTHTRSLNSLARIIKQQPMTVGDPWMRLYVQTDQRIRSLEKHYNRIDDKDAKPMQRRAVEKELLRLNAGMRNIATYKDRRDQGGEVLGRVAWIKERVKEPIDDYLARFGLIKQKHEPTTLQEAVNETQKDRARKEQQAALIWRIEEELKQQQYWPTFITLTVEAMHRAEVKTFQYEELIKWRKRVERTVGHKVKYAGRYERGKKTGAPHWHFILFFENADWAIQKRSMDGRVLAKGLEHTWPWCNQALMIVEPARTHTQDAWGKTGFAWPANRNGTPREAQGTSQLAYYLTKYMTKEKTKWRTKISRGLGLTKLRFQMKSLPNSWLIEHASEPRTAKLGRENPIPRQILRTEARRELWTRQNNQKKWTMVADYEPQDNLIQLLKRLQELSTTLASQSITDTVTRCMQDTGDSRQLDKAGFYLQKCLRYIANHGTFTFETAQSIGQTLQFNEFHWHQLAYEFSQNNNALTLAIGALTTGKRRANQIETIRSMSNGKHRNS